MWFGVIILILLFLTYIIYQRYVPVPGVRDVHSSQLKEHEDWIYVDVSDEQFYNVEPNHLSIIQLPLAYLKRHHNVLGEKSIIVVAPDRAAKNLSVRILKRKGKKVKGFAIKRAKDLETEQHCRPC
ncbi:hypothetical protein [Salsuginibacillus kocurii]|uniref:hypothetical protein n=1 Tax=Salsuginibacillus kocurii TaxID=427078 RepID=UPI00036A39D7|nr:hypothetical protein [Salsuginibacillus kocurii]